MSLKDFSPNLPIKRADMGIVGAVVVALQIFYSSQSNQSIHEELSKLKLDQEQYFARKADLSPIIQRLDKMSDQLLSISNKVNKFTNDYAMMQQEEDLYGCSYTLEEALPWLVTKL